MWIIYDTSDICQRDMDLEKSIKKIERKIPRTLTGGVLECLEEDCQQGTAYRNLSINMSCYEGKVGEVHQEAATQWMP